MKNEIILYQSKDLTTRIEVQVENESVWLNRNQIALLFDRDVKTIGKHINNVFKEGELENKSTVANFATVQNEGGRNVKRQIEFYNLDVIISVGYRVKSKQGTQFRIWANRVLKEYLLKGYIYPLVPFKDKMTQSFLYHLLSSNNFTEYAIKGSQRAGMPKVNRKHLFEYSFSLPPLKEQQKIVKKLNALQTQTKKLEGIYQQKIDDLEELKKSLLQRAFNGQLLIVNDELTTNHL